MLRRSFSEGSLGANNDPAAQEVKPNQIPEEVISPVIIDGFCYYFLSKIILSFGFFKLE